MENILYDTGNLFLGPHTRFMTLELFFLITDFRVTQKIWGQFKKLLIFGGPWNLEDLYLAIAKLFLSRPMTIFVAQKKNFLSWVNLSLFIILKKNLSYSHFFILENLSSH